MDGEALPRDDSRSESDDESDDSSWDVDRDDGIDRGRMPRHFSFDGHVPEATEESFHNAEPHPQAPGSVPADQERQLLLLMLLAQVCALHDPTPRTFTVHVLELFERGILDRQSIHFLFDLGLVPKSSPTNLFISSSPTTHQQQTRRNNKCGPLALVPHRQRSLEAAAIRDILEREDRQTTTPNLQKQPSLHSDPGQRSKKWSIDAHPLSLSRYQREFDQICMLSSGAFGHVFQATNKMDGRDYAIKRIQFSAKGYSSDSVAQVAREVQCLAVCDHPHVVRYFASWLEPSWMTGSSSSSETTRGEAGTSQRHPKLLASIHQLVSSDKKNDASGVSDDLRGYFKDRSLTPRSQRRFSTGESFGESFDASSSYWSENNESEWSGRSKDDSYLDLCPSSPAGWGAKPRIAKPKSPVKSSNYSYKIGMFIQMELCRPTTLADWIRGRSPCLSVTDRVGQASAILQQILGGLAHVHERGIVHRDLKPANVFASLDHDDDKDFHFKIGDFGLSKLVQSAEIRGPHGRNNHHQHQQQIVEYEIVDSDLIIGGHSDELTWQEPLTAGIGTASYAAPEQVASSSYGNKADIFSLGLILLELLCSFSTEHERLQTFHNCRYRRELPEDLNAYPVAVKTILACTNADATKRPTAESLRKVDICSLSDVIEDEDSAHDLQVLQERLAQKEQEVDQLKRELEEKDSTIVELRVQLDKARKLHTTGMRKMYTFGVNRFETPGLHQVAVDAPELSSSSDDEL